MKNKNEVKDDIQKERVVLLERKDVHPSRPRHHAFGQLIQMDASTFNWIDSSVWYLHLAIDDCTGTVTGAYFDYQETLNGYYHVFKQILLNYGIPVAFYTDKRTIFEYKKKDGSSKEDTFTQFSYACSQFGVQIKTSSVSQAKGRVERLNQTLQSRLPILLKRAGITNIDDANKFLESYLEEFNEQFAIHDDNIISVFGKQPPEEKINQTLAILEERQIDSGHCIKYKKKRYYPIDENGKRLFLIKKTKCMVIKTFDKQLFIEVEGHIYSIEELPLHENKKEKAEKKEKKIYRPPANHPWRTFRFQKHKKRVHDQYDY